MDYLKFLVEDVWRFREPIDIIDFGCGIGYMGLTLLDVLPKGSTYTGVDLSEKLLLDAKENLKSFSGSTEFIVSDIFDYETDKTYDLAICQAFLRHIDSPKKALEIMSKSVKSGGSVICVEVNRPFENAGLYIEGARYAPSKKGSLLQKIWDSELEYGERDHAIGFKAPMYMDQIGLVDIDVRLSDRINLMLPSDSDYEKKRNILISSQGWDSRDESSYNSVSMLLKNRGLDEFEAKSYMDIDKEMIELFQSNKQSRMIHTYGLVISRGVKK